MKKIIQQYVLAAALLLVSCQMQAQFVIGKDTLGGKVAYIDASGQHGLIAAPGNQHTAIKWFNGTNVLTGTGTAIETGNSNTEKIVAAQGAGSYAAKLCDDLVLNGYSDWYLPSKDELNQLYINRVAIGGFASNDYWSSSENGNIYAWRQGFSFGTQSYGTKIGTCYVRAVRAF